MKTDERDERLGTVLDGAVTHLRPDPPEPGGVMRRGSVRRMGIVASSIATAAVFVGVVGSAAIQVGKETGNGPATGHSDVFASPDFRWTVPVPDGWWAVAMRTVRGPVAMIRDLRSTLVTDSAADLRGVQSVASPLPPDVADSDVIVLVDPFVGTGSTEPTKLVLGADRDDDANVGWSWRDGKACGATGCARVYLWHGPSASAAALGEAMRIVEGVRLIETRPEPSMVVPTVLFQDLGQDPFSVEYPAGWTLAEEPLTDLIDPREIVSIGTFPLRPGGAAPTDAFLPGNAIADMGSSDVFLTVQERRTPGTASRNPGRPAQFGPDAGCGSDPACPDGTSLGIEGLRAWWIPFTDPSTGRAFYAFVAMGEDAYRDPARSSAAWTILDSMTFGDEILADTALGAAEQPAELRRRSARPIGPSP
ncbi:MAG TPA: hypothetical protein VFP41_09760 [Actinomycetota bacterium]|nr:hypothetical protein [Actinomycetota bacterium]